MKTLKLKEWKTNIKSGSGKFIMRMCGGLGRWRMCLGFEKCMIIS